MSFAALVLCVALVPTGAAPQILELYGQQVEARQKEPLRTSGLQGPQGSGDVTQASTETQREVIETVHAVGTAWAEHDLQALERLVAADYIHTDITGRLQAEMNG